MRQIAERKTAERSTRQDYFPMQLNSSGMMVRGPLARIRMGRCLSSLHGHGCSSNLLALWRRWRVPLSCKLAQVS